jgi:hypothetical protein
MIVIDMMMMIGKAQSDFKEGKKEDIVHDNELLYGCYKMS